MDSANKTRGVERGEAEIFTIMCHLVHRLVYQTLIGYIPSQISLINETIMRKYLLCTLLTTVCFSGHATCAKADYHLTLKDVIYDATSNNDQGTLGYRRLVTNQHGVSRSTLSREYIQVTPMMGNEATLTIKATDGWGKSDFTICAVDSQNKSEELARLTLEKGKQHAVPLKSIKNKRLTVYIKGTTLTNDLGYDITLDRPGMGMIKTPDKTRPENDASGFADIHVHQMADIAYAGGWYFGSHKSGSPEINLANDHGDHGASLAGIDVYGSHHDYRYGYPSFVDWPSAYDISHQQVAGDWLYQAHQQGLSLMVASVVNNQWLCAAVVASGYHHKDYNCSDMESAKRQISAIHEFAKANDWFEVVTDPWQARRAIAKGKLAVMIAVEVSNLLPKSDGDMARQLDELYALDVRSVQLAHEVNSLYAGAALHNDVFKFLGKIKSLFNFGVDYATDESGMHNTIGLTDKGEALLDEMVRHHMPIDLAHLSLKTQQQIIARNKTHYHSFPLFNSHTRIQEMLPESELKKLKEHNTPKDILDAINETHGVIGLRTGDNPMLAYSPKQGKAVANNCQGSTRSLIQFYQYADEHGAKTAFASDFNGFITQIVPRYGEHACSSSDKPKLEAMEQGEPEKNAPNYIKEFQTKGLAHIGLLPAVLADMKSLGANTDNLAHSTEAFLQMWERAYR